MSDDPRLPKFTFPPTDENGESSLPLNEVLPDPRLFGAGELVEVLGATYAPEQKGGVWGWRSGGEFFPWTPPKAVTQRLTRIKWGHKRPRTTEFAQ
jgi:hypothetical protein